MGLIFATVCGDVVAILVGLVAVAYYFVQRTYGIWERKGVDFTKPVFPFGSLRPLLMREQSFSGTVGLLYNSSSAPVVGIWQAFKPTLLIRDPEIVRQVLIKDFNSFRDRGQYCDEKNDPLTGHLFSLPGEKWRKMRSKLSPTFTSGKLKGMFSTLVECGGPLDRFVANAATAEETVEVRELLAQYTTNIIASVAFGIEVDCIADPDTEFRRYGRKVFSTSFSKKIVGLMLIFFPALVPWVGLKLTENDVEAFIINVVRKNLEYREKNNVSRKDFFQLLVEIRNTGTIQEDDNFASTVNSKVKSLSIEECAAQVFVFFLAGFETSSTTMSFALYEMAKNKECLKRAQKEIDEVLAEHNGELTYESVSAMKYLDWCIDETLRMYPPLPILNRESFGTTKIPNTNITLEDKTAIIIPALALQMDPKYWPEPETFIPERFSPEQTNDTTFAERPYLPFGDGPRNCIGMRLGKMQTKVGLIVMLQKYNYELAGSSKLPITMQVDSFLLAPEGGINLKITHRAKK